MMKKLLIKIPKLPLSALIFCLTFFTLVALNAIPSPKEIVLFLEGLYYNYGLLGVFISSFLEGLVYLGFYFPGSLILVLAIILSDGTPISLFLIIFVATIAVTLTTIINYFFGRCIFSKSDNQKILKKSKKFSKGLFLSMLHPNILAFYFFNRGIEKKSIWKVLYVPIFLIPYLFVLALIFSFFRYSIRNEIENPYVVISAVVIWLIIATLMKCKRQSYDIIDTVP